jgi:cytochrome c
MTFPVPRDIPLPLPAPEGLLEVLLIVSFIVHIVFVHMMLGGSLFSLLCQIKGLKTPAYETMAYKIMQAVTVNKSMAVVMGVAPLLIINTLYAPQFYASSALIGSAWMAVIPLVIIAFLLAYAHKFWWHRFVNIPELHIGISALESALFLFIPLIYMTNVNLMLFPEYWSEVRGFFSAMLLPNVLPRYLHFVSAAILFSSLFFVWWSGRPSFQEDVKFSPGQSQVIRRFFYAFAFGATLFQIFSGLIVFVSLPPQGMSWEVTLLLFFGGSLALPALRWMWGNISHPENSVDDHFRKIIALFACALVVMGVARHEYRENALHDHKVAIAEKTANYMAAVAEAQEQADLVAQAKQTGMAEPGEAGFKQNCAACHHHSLPTVGPSLEEIRSIYPNDPAGVARWTKNPGKKRGNSMQMPGFPQLDEAELLAISEFMLK